MRLGTELTTQDVLLFSREIPGYSENLIQFSQGADVVVHEVAAAKEEMAKFTSAAEDHGQSYNSRRGGKSFCPSETQDGSIHSPFSCWALIR